MTLLSIFDGEGFRKAPAQFVEIVTNWSCQNKDKRLITLIDQFHNYSINLQAEMLVEWIDTEATTHQRDSCIQFIMDAIEPDSCSDDSLGDESDIYFDEMGYGHEV